MSLSFANALSRTTTKTAVLPDRNSVKDTFIKSNSPALAKSPTLVPNSNVRNLNTSDFHLTDKIWASRTVKPNFSAASVKSRSHSNPRKSPDINNELKKELSNYLEEIKKITGREVSQKQVTLIENYINTTPIHKLSYEDMNNHRKDFSMNKREIREAWELNNNATWPKYTENVVIDGKIARQAGYAYDAHHIIENAFGGPNVWWNMQPARYPEQHQDGIHKDDGIAAKLFGKISPKHHVNS